MELDLSIENKTAKEIARLIITCEQKIKYQSRKDDSTIATLLVTRPKLPIRASSSYQEVHHIELPASCQPTCKTANLQISYQVNFLCEFQSGSNFSARMPILVARPRQGNHSPSLPLPLSISLALSLSPSPSISLSLSPFLFSLSHALSLASLLLSLSALARSLSLSLTLTLSLTQPLSPLLFLWHLSRALSLSHCGSHLSLSLAPFSRTDTFYACMLLSVPSSRAPALELTCNSCVEAR